MSMDGEDEVRDDNHACLPRSRRAPLAAASTASSNNLVDNITADNREFVDRRLKELND